MEERERRLLAPNAAAWAAPRSHRAEFRRGLVEAIDAVDRSPAEAWGRFDAHPIREAHFKRLSEEGLEEIAGSEHLRRVESLGIDCHRVDTAIDTLLASGRCSRLRRLAIWAEDVTDDRAARWAGSPALARLQGLSIDLGFRSEGRFLRQLAFGLLPDLAEFTIGWSDRPAHAEALDDLVRSAAWPRLRDVATAGGPAFPWSEALAGAPLRWLAVQWSPGPIGPALADALAAFQGEPTLEELTVPNDFATSESLSRVLASDALAGLRRLHLGRDRVADDDVRRLAASPLLAGLRRLTLTVTPNDEPALAELLGSSKLGRLTHLSVYGRALSPDAARALARNPSRSRLRSLAVVAGDEASLLALADGEPYPDLHTLRLHWWQEPRPAALERLLNSPAFPRLCVVPFGVDAEDVEGMAEAMRCCERVAWAGYEVDDGSTRGVRVGVKPEGVFLPDYLAEV